MSVSIFSLFDTVDGRSNQISKSIECGGVLMEEIRALVRQEWEALLVVKAQQAEIIASLRSITEDHEKRIRLIERILGYGVGVIGAIKLFLLRS
jgi:hypothetical protein